MAINDYRIQKSIDKVYQLINHPLVTPASLLENLNIENYSKIVYSKKGDLLNVELTCRILGKEMKYLYSFNAEQNLQTIITQTENEEPYLVFNRTDELKSALASYNKVVDEKVC